MTSRIAYEDIAQLPEVWKKFTDTSARLPTGQSVIIIGDTGSGKSTLINLLARVPLQAVYNRSMGTMSITTDTPLPKMPIGCTLLSETSNPNRWDDGQGTTYWDCPGWQDNRGPVQEMINALLIKKVFATSEKVKILVLMPETHFTAPKATQLQPSMNTLTHLLPDNLEHLKESIALVVSQADQPRTQAHIVNYISDVLSQVELDKKTYRLLQILQQQPIIIFKRPLRIVLRPDVGHYPLDTTSFREELLFKIQHLCYATRVDAKISISPSCQMTVQRSHIDLVETINRTFSQFTETFQQSLKQFAHPATDLSHSLNQTERHKLQRPIDDGLIAFGQLTHIKPTKETLPNLVEGCASIASICGSHLPTDEVSYVLKTLPAIEQLEEFIDPSIQMRLDISQAFRALLNSSDLLVKAKSGLIAMENKEKEIANKRDADQRALELKIQHFLNHICKKDERKMWEKLLADPAKRDRIVRMISKL